MYSSVVCFFHYRKSALLVEMTFALLRVICPGHWLRSGKLWPLSQGHQRLNSVYVLSLLPLPGSPPGPGQPEGWHPQLGQTTGWWEAWWGGHLSLFQSTFSSISAELANKQLKMHTNAQLSHIRAWGKWKNQSYQCSPYLKCWCFVYQGIFVLILIFQNYCIKTWVYLNYWFP